MCFFVCGVVVSPEFYVPGILYIRWFRWGNLDWGVCPYAWARAFIFFHFFFLSRIGTGRRGARASTCFTFTPAHAGYLHIAAFSA